MHRVHLAHSQYHEAHRGALDALLARLRERPAREANSWRTGTQSGKRSLLQREIQRVGTRKSATEVNVAEMLLAILSIFAPVITQKELQVNVDRAALNALPQVKADGTILRQLLVQMLGNALRSIHRGRLELRFGSLRSAIEIEAEAAGDLVGEPTIKDWAIGDLCRALGATMTESQRGSTVRIRLHLPKDRRKLVVLIDNDQDLGALFSRYLFDREWTLVSAQSADEGLRLVHELAPDAVILDVMMPERDGWQVLSSLRTGDQDTSTHVIVCSVLEQPELALALGADMFLPKPVSQMSLLQALEHLEDLVAES